MLLFPRSLCQVQSCWDRMASLMQNHACLSSDPAELALLAVGHICLLPIGVGPAPASGNTERDQKWNRP
jgi:hypothetical protein